MLDKKCEYSGDILEASIEKIEFLLKKDYGISKRSVAILAIQEDEEILALIKTGEPENFARIVEIIDHTKSQYDSPLSYIISIRRQEEASRITTKSVEQTSQIKLTFKEKLSRAMIRPITGLPLLVLILYYGLYKFVGEFGAGTVVDFIETDIFEKIIRHAFIKNTIAWS